MDTATTETPTQQGPWIQGCLADGLFYFRRFLLWLTLLAVVVGAVWMLVKQQLDERIRTHLLQTLRAHYDPLGIDVQIGSARFIQGRGLELRKIELREVDGSGPDVPLVVVDELFVKTDASLFSLASQQVEPEWIEVRRMQMVAQRSADGQWPLQKVFSLPKMSSHRPPIRLRDASIVLSIVGEKGRVHRRLHQVNLNLQAKPRQAAVGTATGSTSAGDRIEFQGSFAGDFVNRVGLQGFFYTDTWECRLKGFAQQVDLIPELHQLVPTAGQETLDALRTLRGRLNLAFDMHDHLRDAMAPTFLVSGQLQQGKIDHPRLPFYLDEIRARFRWSNEAFKVWDVVAHSSLGDIELAVEQGTPASGSVLTLRANADSLKLDRRIVEFLPEKMKETWNHYDPAGTVRVDLTMSYRDQQWDPDLTIQLQDVSFAYHKFPYRLDGAMGTVRWNKQVCSLDVRALAAGRMVRLNGLFQNPGPHYTGKLEIDLNGSIPLDERLLKALAANPKLEANVRSFHPTGMMSYHGVLEKKHPQQAQVHRTMTIGLHGCSVRYDSFAYPLNRIYGTIKIENDRVIYDQIEGQNNGGYVSCNGYWDPREGSYLKLVGTSIPLEEELRLALDPDAQRLWSELHPRGTIDHVEVELTKPLGSERLQVNITAQKWKQDREIDRQSLSVQPTWFPYKLNDVTGVIQLRQGKLTLTDIEGRHGSSTISLGGTGTIGDVGWEIVLNRMSVDRLTVDRDFIAALPRQLASALDRLQPQGNIHMAGTLRAWGRRDRRPTPSIQSPEDHQAGLAWDWWFDLENGKILLGKEIENIHGGIRLTGHSGPNGTFCNGWVEVDSLIFNEIQLTSVQGPFHIDRERLTFGTWVQSGASDNRAPLRSMTATLFDGMLLADGQVLLGEDYPFDVQATLREANLQSFSQEFAPGLRDLSGQAFATLELGGNTQGSHTYRGRGKFRLRNAKIYEVPVILAMLKLLSIRQIDRTAFTTCNVDFQIGGEHFYFNRLEFIGDAISLKGKGEMDFDKKVDLQFYSMVGRDEIFVPIVSPLFGAASQQILLIEVDGALDDPRVNKKAFPALNDTLRQIFPELEQRPDRNQTELPTARKWFEQSQIFRTR